MLSTRINTLEKLNHAKLNKQSVICPTVIPWSKPKPAAVLIELQGSTLLRLFIKGMYIYNKEGKCQPKRT